LVGVRVKVARTLRVWVMLTMQGSVPLQPSPLQPVKVEPLAAVAVSVTLVLKSNAALHVAGQLSPTGEADTVPLPVPAWLTVRVTCWKVIAKSPPPPNRSPEVPA